MWTLLTTILAARYAKAAAIEVALLYWGGGGFYIEGLPQGNLFGHYGMRSVDSSVFLPCVVRPSMSGSTAASSASCCSQAGRACVAFRAGDLWASTKTVQGSRKRLPQLTFGFRVRSRVEGLGCRAGGSAGSHQVRFSKGFLGCPKAFPQRCHADRPVPWHPAGRWLPFLGLTGVLRRHKRGSGFRV